MTLVRDIFAKFYLKSILIMKQSFSKFGIIQILQNFNRNCEELFVVEIFFDEFVDYAADEGRALRVAHHVVEQLGVRLLIKPQIAAPGRVDVQRKILKNKLLIYEKEFHWIEHCFPKL